MGAVDKSHLSHALRLSSGIMSSDFKEPPMYLGCRADLDGCVEKECPGFSFPILTEEFKAYHSGTLGN